eukprot:gene61879-84621_t
MRFIAPAWSIFAALNSSILDDRVPSKPAANGMEGHLAASYGSADDSYAASANLKAGTGPITFVIDAVKRRSQDYEAGGRPLTQLDSLGLSDLGVFFDDMKGDLPELAARQIEIAHWIAERSTASRVIVCPSYYTDDPVLDRVFGQRPRNYLEDLGAGLDPALHLMWTGEEVCAREVSP